MGGAARAAYRIHKSLISANQESRMHVINSTSNDWSVIGTKSVTEKAITRFRGVLTGVLPKVMKTSNPILHSPAVIPSNWSSFLNRSDSDIINLHWINGEMMSIADIGKINKPAFWTLHDMWAFCGAEHYTEEYRWQEGYKKNNRPEYESGFDLNRWTAARKLRHWKKPINLIAPSQWLSNCVKNSALLKDWPVTVIPNAIDTNSWLPIDKDLARTLLKLPLGKPLLLNGAMGGTQDPRKGFDLLSRSLEYLRGECQDIEIVIFGQLPPKNEPDIGFRVHYMGHMHDDLSLSVLYSAADVMVIPSRQDNLPNTGVEAHACGLPVVAFNTGGLPDIVSHKTSGYLASPFDTVDLANGIKWVLNDSARRSELSRSARLKAVSNWSYEVVGEMYAGAFRKALS